MNASGAVVNLTVLEDLYGKWVTDPTAVSTDWQQFFSGYELGASQAKPMAAAPATGTAPATAMPSLAMVPESAANSDAVVHGTSVGLQQRVDAMMYAYRDIGHTICDLDPLDLNNQKINPDLELDRFGIAESDLATTVTAGNILGMPSRAPIADVLGWLKETYCRTIGVEFMHIQDHRVRKWLREKMEPNRNRTQFTAETKRRILIKLHQAELLEQFIHTKFLGQKRFSLEGGEALIPALDHLIETGGELGVKEICFGMAHRGRLNVLCNILNKSYEEVFTEFEGRVDSASMEGDGDVKYHMGFSSDHVTATGQRVHLTLAANPSHLEAVDPVVLGRVRAKQRQHGDMVHRRMAMPVLIHGDAAFAGQGLVMEVLQLSKLEGYRTGGTIHIVQNNQIGFTTLPADARSTRYCTDLAKMLEAPIFHVNADDVEAVVHVIKIAVEYRQAFGQDVFIDLTCYRRYGHNETDEPNYTQPTMYARIAQHDTPAKVYVGQLLERGEIDEAEVDGIATIMKNQLTDALETVKVKPAHKTDRGFAGHWSGLRNQYSHAPVATGVSLETLDLIGRALSTWPKSFTIHPKIEKLVTERGRIIRERQPVEWALGELLAVGSLLVEGTPCRLSGQDCRRGTFTQRHSYWYDLDTRERYRPLDNIKPGQEKFCVYNSPLSEAAVLGFDYGYSLAEPNMLIMWEAQFGDFANGAQNIIDQFIASSESKWGRVSGLVMLLPHGQEGMGPEHSSARLERFLQLCGDENMQVVHCTTAAQHFHVLRRQMRRPFRKPLICMTPKGHLRSKAASSPILDFVDGRFHEVLEDPAFATAAAGTKPAEPATANDPAAVTRVCLVSGKLYHELAERRTTSNRHDVALVRVEQLYPFPTEQLKAAVAPFTKATEVCWIQEEPQNMGGWSFARPWVESALGRAPVFLGRDAAASPAVGSLYVFKKEQEAVVASAFAPLPATGR